METDVLLGQTPAAPLVTSKVSGGQRASSQFAETAVKEAEVRPSDSDLEPQLVRTSPNTAVTGLGCTVGTKE